MSRFRCLGLLPFVPALAACHAVVLDPAGDVAAQQRDLVLDATALMLLIIVPVMALTALFAWRYRQSNSAARYEPDWDHSTQLELVIWSVPLLIIICLGALTWVGTHLLDPYRPINRIAPGQPAAAAPLRVDVVALDWKWLFIYPEYGIATVNELAAPVDRPIDFRITSSSVMNSFYIPALAGQIYAMPGMETELHAVMNKAGTYTGFSANYSGAGFSGMHFTFHGLKAAEFERWLAQVRAGGGALSRSVYLELERPTENEPVHRYAAVEPGLYKAILGMCVEAGKMCASQMMAIDARGGLGIAGIYNIRPFEYGNYAPRSAVFHPQRSYVASLCSSHDDADDMRDAAAPAAALGDSPLLGAGLPSPPLTLFRAQTPAVAAVPRLSTPY